MKTTISVNEGKADNIFSAGSLVCRDNYPNYVALIIHNNINYVVVTVFIIDNKSNPFQANWPIAELKPWKGKITILNE